MAAGRVWSFLVALFLIQQQATFGQNEDFNTQMKKLGILETSESTSIENSKFQGEDLYEPILRKYRHPPLMFTSSEEKMVLERTDWQFVINRLRQTLIRSFVYLISMLPPRVKKAILYLGKLIYLRYKNDH